MKFNEQILRDRSRLGLTQEQAAQKLGMSRRAYIELEKGRRHPAEYEAQGIAMILNKKT